MVIESNASPSQIYRHQSSHNPFIAGLQQTAAAIVSGQDLEQVLIGILDACGHQLGYLYPSVALLERQQDRLVGRQILSPQSWAQLRRTTKDAGVPLDGLFGMRMDRRATRRTAEKVGVPPDAISYQLNMTDNLVAQVFTQGSPRVTNRLHDLLRPRLGAQDSTAAQRALGLATIALLPVLAGERCVGVFAVAIDDHTSFSSSHWPVLALLVEHVVIAIEQDRLKRNLVDLEQHVSFLLKRTIEAQEEERERICLEVHDGIAQSLAPAFHYLQTLSNNSKLSDDLRQLVFKASRLVRDANREAREVIASLRPAGLDTVGLVATLRCEIDELQAEAGLRITFDADEARYPKAVETTLYRIIREAINNIIKHARATQGKVQVKHEANRVVAEVQDNGVGFIPYALERRQHTPGVGLLSMRKRAELLQGSFQVMSKPGEGTRVRVEIPLCANDCPQNDASH